MRTPLFSPPQNQNQYKEQLHPMASQPYRSQPCPALSSCLSSPSPLSSILLPWHWTVPSDVTPALTSGLHPLLTSTWSTLPTFLRAQMSSEIISLTYVLLINQQILGGDSLSVSLAVPSRTVTGTCSNLIFVKGMNHRTSKW